MSSAQLAGARRRPRRPSTRPRPARPPRNPPQAGVPDPQNRRAVELSREYREQFEDAPVVLGGGGGYLPRAAVPGGPRGDAPLPSLVDGGDFCGFLEAGGDDDLWAAPDNAAVCAGRGVRHSFRVPLALLLALELCAPPVLRGGRGLGLDELGQLRDPVLEVLVLLVLLLCLLPSSRALRALGHARCARGCRGFDGEWGWEGRRPGYVDLQCRWCPGGGSAPGTAGACARAVHEELARCQPCCAHCTSSCAEQFGTPCPCKAESPRCSLLLLAALLCCLEFCDTPFADGLVHRSQCTVGVHRVSATAADDQWSC